MSPKEKTKFEELAKQDKARYDQEMMNYNPGKRGRKTKKDPSAPRRPPYVPLKRLFNKRAFGIWRYSNVVLLQYLNELLLPFVGPDFSCSVLNTGPVSKLRILAWASVTWQRSLARCGTICPTLRNNPSFQRPINSRTNTRRYLEKKNPQSTWLQFRNWLPRWYWYFDPVLFLKCCQNDKINFKVHDVFEIVLPLFGWKRGWFMMICSVLNGKICLYSTSLLTYQFIGFFFFFAQLHY